MISRIKIGTTNRLYIVKYARVRHVMFIARPEIIHPI